MAALIGALFMSAAITKTADVLMDNVISPVIDKLDDATNYVKRNNPVALYDRWERKNAREKSKKVVNEIRAKYSKNKN
jgi:hypothetical protein